MIYYSKIGITEKTDLTKSKAVDNAELVTADI